MPSSPQTLPKPEGGFLEALRKPRVRPLVMGIVNVTPDSFYQASRAQRLAAALERARRLEEEGADIIDLGGQSTRPGSEPVPLEEELRRVLPVVTALSGRCRAFLSIDTDKASVARACRQAGASILNDVSALRGGPELAREAARFEAVILMHRGGDSPRTMQESPRYADVVAEVKGFLRERLEVFTAAGGDPGRALVDPGIGFGKDLGHNLSLLKRLSEFGSLAPVVLGASRKSFLSRITPDSGPEDRLAGSLAAACWAALEGAAVVRVHDVAETRRALAALAAISEAK